MVRLIAGNPVTMGEMTRHVPDAGSYAPVTILIEELPGGGTRLAYDSVVSELTIYGDPAATQVAENLDTEVLPFAASSWLVPSGPLKHRHFQTARPHPGLLLAHGGGVMAGSV